MIGLGTLINTAVVVAGGLIGLCLKNGLKRQMQEILMQACGVATIFIGAAGALSKMLGVGEEGITTTGTMLLIFSLVLGGIAGEWLDMEQKMDGLGEKIPGGEPAARSARAGFVPFGAKPGGRGLACQDTL